MHSGRAYHSETSAPHCSTTARANRTHTKKKLNPTCTNAPNRRSSINGRTSNLPPPHPRLTRISFGTPYVLHASHHTGSSGPTASSGATCTYICAQGFRLVIDPRTVPAVGTDLRSSWLQNRNRPHAMHDYPLNPPPMTPLPRPALRLKSRARAKSTSLNNTPPDKTHRKMPSQAEVDALR